jgi:hypothetical protein
MSYDEKVISVPPGEDFPEPDHSDEFYCHKELIKKKGRKKKADPTDFRLTYIPWCDINDTELMELTLYGLEFGSRVEMERWNVICRGLRRSELIGLVRGEVDPNTLQSNPTHVARDRLSKLIHNNWKYIHSQIRCNTLCWECPDAKALECILENRDMLKGEDL